MKHAAGLAVLLVLVTASTAAAQATRPAPRPAAPPRPVLNERIFISVNGVYQVASNDFDDRATFRENAEDGHLSTDYSVEAGPAFDVSGWGILWRNLGVGVGVSRFSRSTPTAIDADVPHPFFFNRPRTIAQDVGGLTREELAVHVQARGTFPIRNRILLTVFGGPSFFQVTQDVVDDVEYADDYPYDAITFNRAVTRSADESAIGFNAGADVGYFFTRTLGVGASLQYAGTTADFDLVGGAADLKAGGLQFGGGLRVRF